MSVTRHTAKTHPHYQGYDDSVDDRGTLPETFDPLNDRFGFTIDVAASSENAKCARYYTRDDDGLGQCWAGERVWCNPPYSVIAPWVEKAWAEADAAELIVMLLPASRTEQRWWQDLVEPRRDQAGSPLVTEFLPGRLRFLLPGERLVSPYSRPPFGNVLLIWNADRKAPDFRQQPSLDLSHKAEHRG